MSKELNDMLSSPTKGVEEASGVLARLFRLILMDLNISHMGLNSLMIRWLEDPRNGIANNGKSRSSERGNMIKEMTRGDMTWKVFVKCIRFLAPIEMRFEVHLKWSAKKTTVHGINLHIHEAIREEQDAAKAQTTAVPPAPVEEVKPIVQRTWGDQ